MFGVLVNTAAVVAGSLIGLACKQGIPKKYHEAIMWAISLFVVYMGVDGALECENALIVILSMVLGAALGTAVDIDRRFNALGEKLGEKFQRSGFVTSTLIFCVGAMAVLGALNAGLQGDNTILFSKSVMDGTTSIMLSAALGVGVLFSALAILLYQGAIALLAGVIAPFLTDAAVANLTCAGSLMVLALGLNLLGATKIKVANLLPALLLAPVFTILASYLPL